MTETELLETIKTNASALLKHNNMRDVAFYPTSLEVTPDSYKLFGMWYSEIFDDLMGDVFGNPLRETITIKKDDLASWTVKTA